ncbi:hypothetical protein [Enterobacter sp.]|uniref:hypothetical protein n=1 Tax=Enterobacter sp. TaxID=42895 RepID=UPI00296E4701|nr:hypothetical protein [Enterobacter sp.]
MELKPGQNTGKNGGIYQEKGPRDGLKDNYTTIADNRKAPPTQNPNSTWVLVKKTPNSNR